MMYDYKLHLVIRPHGLACGSSQPFLVDVMVKEGFTHLGNETMRKTVANHITLKEAFHHHGKEEAEMEKILVDAIETHQNEKK